MYSVLNTAVLHVLLLSPLHDVSDTDVIVENVTMLLSGVTPGVETPATIETTAAAARKERMKDSTKAGR